MEINRLKNDKHREDELAYICEGAGKSERIINLTYYAKIASGIRVKVEYDHDFCNNREVGLIITIINSSYGHIIDKMHLRFDHIIGNESEANLAQIGRNGWTMSVLKLQKDTIRKTVQDYISFWSA